MKKSKKRHAILPRTQYLITLSVNMAPATLSSFFSFCVFFLARGSTPVKTDGSEWFYVSKRFLTESVILRGTQYLTTLSANMAELARRHIFEIVYFFTNYVVLLSASPAWVSPGAWGSPGPLNSLILPSPWKGLIL